MVAPEDANKNENVEKIILDAKEELVKNGIVKPKVLFERRGRLIPPAPMEALDELDERLGISRNEYDRKSRDVYMAGVLARLVHADKVFLVWDAAIKECSRETKVDDTMTPLTYPRSMRTDCLIVQTVDVILWKEEVKILPYKGGEGKPIEFLPLPEGWEKSSTRFLDLIRKGYEI